MKQLVLLLLLPACEQSVSNYLPPIHTRSEVSTPVDAGSDAHRTDATTADTSLDKDSDISSASETATNAQVVETTSAFYYSALAKDAAISTSFSDAATAQDGSTESKAAPDASPDAATDAGDTDTDADAGPFVCPIPDAPGSECDLVTSCGCADGFVCRTADMHTGQTLCFDAGITPPYSSCGFDQECGADSVCEGALCRPLCDAPDTLCNDDSWCGKVTGTGRTVCLGNCNALHLAIDEWNASPAWIKVQALQFERGLNTLPLRTLDYSGCGEGAYCRPGLAGTSPFPYCIPATGTGELGSTCTLNQDCISGLGCGENECRILSFTDAGCPSGDGSRAGLNADEWIAPDGYNNLALCLPE